jgi:branched-chain amino acid transport system ATP-binding protein
LTVRENIAVGAHLSRPRRADALAAADEIAARVGIAAQLDKPAAGLTVAGRKRLELARALALAPRLLLLDEVLAGLNPSEVRDMVPVIRGLVDQGITVIMIEHIMHAVMNLAQHVLVLSEGRIIAGGAPNEIAGNPQVVEAYLGRGAAQRMMQAGASHA